MQAVLLDGVEAHQAPQMAFQSDWLTAVLLRFGPQMGERNFALRFRAAFQHVGRGFVRDGDQVIFITPARHDSNAAFRLNVPVGASHASPSQLSAVGYRGAGVAVDYRGEPTLAVWRYVPALGGGLVVKIDSREAFAPIARLKTLAFALAGATLIVVVLAALSVARSIARPVVKLTAATAQIAAGDLSRRVDVEARNEIGQLAVSFNRMTSQLGESIEQLKATTAAKERIESELQHLIDQRSNPWGVTVSSVEMRDIVIPGALQDAMSREAQAAREKQARIILGQAEMEIAQSFQQAAKAYHQDPTALHLRAMNMLYEGLKEKGALMLVPSSAVESTLGNETLRVFGSLSVG